MEWILGNWEIFNLDNKYWLLWHSGLLTKNGELNCEVVDCLHRSWIGWMAIWMALLMFVTVEVYVCHTLSCACCLPACLHSESTSALIFWNRENREIRPSIQPCYLAYGHEVTLCVMTGPDCKAEYYGFWGVFIIYLRIY